MNQLLTQLFKIRNTHHHLGSYKSLCYDFDEKLNAYLHSQLIDPLSLKQIVILTEQERIGSSQTISKALQLLAKAKPDNIRYQQTILGLAAKHNLCSSINIHFDIQQIQPNSFNPDILLYLTLTKNSDLVPFCQDLQIKHRKVHYYLQYFLPHYLPSKEKVVLQESNKQKEYEKKISEEYTREYQIGLYHCDFFLPKSNTIVEVNGYKHYIHFKERRTGIYQQKYNYLTKKGYNIREVDEFE